MTKLKTLIATSALLLSIGGATAGCGTSTKTVYVPVQQQVQQQQAPSQYFHCYRNVDGYAICDP